MNKLLLALCLLFVLLTIGSGLYINHLEKQLANPQTIEKERIVTVTKYDTVRVQSEPIVITKYVEKPIYISSADSSTLDTLYTNLKEAALAGTPAIVQDSVHFGKHYLETSYTFPPVSKFDYKFLPGPDSVITEKTTITHVVDKTPPLSIYFGPRMLQYSDGIKSKIAGTAGLKIKNLGFELTYFENHDKMYGVNWYVPITFRLF